MNEMRKFLVLLLLAAMSVIGGCDKPQLSGQTGPNANDSVEAYGFDQDDDLLFYAPNELPDGTQTGAFFGRLPYNESVYNDDFSSVSYYWPLSSHPAAFSTDQWNDASFMDIVFSDSNVSLDSDAVESGLASGKLEKTIVSTSDDLEVYILYYSDRDYNSAAIITDRAFIYADTGDRKAMPICSFQYKPWGEQSGDEAKEMMAYFDTVVGYIASTVVYDPESNRNQARNVFQAE
jgi:hypothetical protein